ncbi:MAG TPA: EAL domain-containing protein [Acidimicrobiales bacterium]|nr:EAL domain-containing protein [Acidimicrobiales bacterium]
MVLARLRTLRGLAAVLAVVGPTLLALVDLAVGESLVLTGMLVGGPLLAWPALGPRATALVGAYVTGLALVLGALQWDVGQTEHTVIVVGVVAVTALAVALARRREAEEAEAAELRGHRSRADAAVARIIGMQRISEAGLAHEDLDAVLGEVVLSVRAAFRADSATVLLVDADGLHLRVRASVGVDEVGVAFPLGRGIGGRVLESGRPMLVDDLDAVEVSSAALRASGIRSLVVVPLLVGREVVGVVSVGSRRLAAFTGADVARLEHLASRVSMAVDRVRLFEALRDSEEALRAVVDSAVDAIVRIDAAGRIITANPATSRLFGYDEAELRGRGAEVLLAEPDRSDHAAHLWVYGPVRGARPLEVRREVVGRRQDGSTIPIQLTVTENDLHGEVVHVAVLRDISEHKAVERRLAHAALHDPLTGLGNRLLLLDRLERARAAVLRRERISALMFLDLDRFKRINDSLGHDAGDRVLTTVAGRLRAELRPEDTVARVGGDEFVVLVEDLEGIGRATEIADRIHDAVAAPMRIGDDEVFLTTSVGVVVIDHEAGSPAELLRQADSAMYRAKERGRSRVEAFDTGMQERALERLQLETQLHRGLEARELEVHFQPQYRVSTGAVSGVEALVRWRHPERGLLFPGQFLREAEESGLIVPLGRWVLDEACRAAAGWPTSGAAPPPSVWVNLCGRELAARSVVEHVAEVLERSGLAPSRLMLEVTEGALMDDPSTTSATLRSMRDLGVGVAIDDFGTGYSSLAYLRDFPVDAIKLDRTFLTGIGDGVRDPLVGVVAGLARSLDMLSVAEGVEDDAQLAAVTELGYDLVQGYLLARPAPEIDLTDTLVRPQRR